MLQRSTVLEVEVEHLGTVHRATYFVEGDIIHAFVGGKLLMSPLGTGNPADRVRSLLTGHLLMQTRRAANVGKWTMD